MNVRFELVVDIMGDLVPFMLKFLDSVALLFHIREILGQVNQQPAASIRIPAWLFKEIVRRPCPWVSAIPGCP